MNHSMINAASGMRAMQLRVDTIANNIANSDTVGYKSQDTAFASFLIRHLNNQPYAYHEPSRLTPPGTRPGFGAKEAVIQTSFDQGAIKTTDIPTDLYLEGEDAFFRVQRRQANGDQATLFTRNGNLKWMPINGGMQLVTAAGDYVMDNGATPQPVTIPQGATHFTVKADGQITYRLNGEEQIGPRIGVYSVQNPNILHPVGENYYQLPQGAQLNEFARLSNANGAAMTQGIAVRQGGLEMSNVDLRKEMTSLIEAQRALQFNARALSYNDQMMDITNRIFRG
ncbi:MULTISPECIES: flagellar hook-basal body protein [Aneurinibacillus]|uniref:Flagellar hook-basal body complex protein FlhP n=1 Tax=Aneurinibacillus danicus TaxID=267746 RepID=A0A511VDJ2_9BACL|nr:MULTISPECIES: flagellar hook-basal body protein [Aneurinibacillus]GEN36018.1 flagellar hook-basal body complex protein FlhP [Aneurinibacillus danicus]